MKKTKLIVFSGGCLSGKTTTMLALKAALEKKGLTVDLLNELMREQGFTSIDEIRKDPKAYLAMQVKVTTQKMKQEREAVKSGLDFVLADRSIIDSYFYLLFYTDKSAYTYDDWATFRGLVSEIEGHIHWSRDNYAHLLFFRPIEEICFDQVFRPKHIDLLKYIESEQILSLLRSHYPESFRFMGGPKITIIDLNLNEEFDLDLMNDIILPMLDLQYK